MRLHPKRDCGLDVVAQVATAFPKWQVSVVVSAEFLRHFSKDWEIARNTDTASDDHELGHEIGLLCKSTVIDSSNVHRLTVEDLAQRRRQVAALVKKHRETEREIEEDQRGSKGSCKTCCRSTQECDRCPAASATGAG